MRSQGLPYREGTEGACLASAESELSMECGPPISPTQCQENIVSATNQKRCPSQEPRMMAKQGGIPHLRTDKLRDSVFLEDTPKGNAKHDRPISGYTCGMGSGI